MPILQLVNYESISRFWPLFLIGGKGEGGRGKGKLSCPMISCHINIFDLLIIGEYHAVEVGTSLQYEF